MTNSEASAEFTRFVNPALDDGRMNEEADGQADDAFGSDDAMFMGLL